MSEDSMRYNLVTTFVCAKCGAALTLSYETPKQRFDQFEATDGITGAAKVQARFAIHPCQICYSAATRPIEALREALSAISKGTP